jgi:hypothetical protein
VHPEFAQGDRLAETREHHRAHCGPLAQDENASRSTGILAAEVQGQRIVGILADQDHPGIDIGLGHGAGQQGPDPFLPDGWPWRGAPKIVA